MAGKDKDAKIPRNVLLLAILNLALFLSVVIVTVHAIITGERYVIDNFSMLSSQDLWVVAFAAAIFAVVFCSVGVGLFFLRGWARTVFVAFGMMGIVVYSLKAIILTSSLASQVNEGAELDVPHLVVLAVTLASLIFLVLILLRITKPREILAFEAREMEMVRKKITTLERKIALGRRRCNAGEITKAELANLRADCLAEERLLRSRIRHLEKVRLGRERTEKESLERKEERKKEKKEKREERKEAREERKAEREIKREEKKKAAEEGEGKEEKGKEGEGKKEKGEKEGEEGKKREKRVKKKTEKKSGDRESE